MSEPTTQPDLSGFIRKVEAYTLASSDFWKHLVMVHATVLGLTIGLMGGSGGAASIPLKLSWGMFILSIVVGSLLVKVHMDQGVIAAARAWSFDYDTREIEAMITRGELQRGDKTHSGLLLAATIQLMPKNLKWTALRTEADQYVRRLPSAVFLSLFATNKLLDFYEAHSSASMNTFYLLSLSAFCLLLASVFCR